MTKHAFTRILFTVLSLIAINGVEASTISNQHAFTTVKQQLAQAKYIQGKFIQKREIAVLSKPLLSSGHFSLSQTNGLKWIQEKPFSSTLTLNSTLLTQTINNNPPMVLTKDKQPLVFSFSKIFLSVFTGDEASLRQAFNLSFEGTPKHWHMDLVPRSSPINKAIRSINLEGGKTINKITVNNIQKDKLIINFHDVKVIL